MCMVKLYTFGLNFVSFTQHSKDECFERENEAFDFT